MAEKRKKRDRSYYLNGGADVLSRQVYDLCKKQAENKADADLKSLKELCGVLKEAVNISLSLEKADDGEKDALLITFDDDVLELAE